MYLKTVEAWEAGIDKLNGSAERLMQVIEANSEAVMQEIKKPEEDLVSH